MTPRRLGIVALCAILAFGLAYGFERLSSGGVPIPAATPDVAASASPSAGGPDANSPGASAPTAGLPNQELTPGAINPAATQDNLADTVCKSGWAASVRPPSAYTSALKVAQIIQYGYADKDPRHYQEDHLVPLELGGAPRDKRNLWPEPNTITLGDGTTIGSREKDDLEDALHRDVCAGTLSLADAQRSIARNWIAAWQAAGRP